jgi:dimeric dUTPase (all-alpha-NTP-PPase superfamily)
MILTSKELESMLDAQQELNEKYTPSWTVNVPKESIFTAIFTEVAEFLESSPKQWTWWKSYLDNDVQNQYIEIVDVIHFAMSYMLIDTTKEDILKMNSNSRTFDTKNLFSVLENFRVENTIKNFYELIQAMVDYADLDGDKLIRIYFEKLAINHKRIDGGYQEGTYEKIDENGQEDNRVIQI